MNGGIGATNAWERVPSSFYGLSSVRARKSKPGRKGGSNAGDGADFLRGGEQRHGLAEWFKSQAGASAVSRLKSMKELLESTAIDPNKPVKVEWRPFRTTALFEASVNGEVQLAMLLLHHGARVDTQLGTEMTSPLYNAALNGHAKVVAVLCDAGADCGATTCDGLTPLYAACQHGHTSTIIELLRARSMNRTVAELPLPVRLGGATPLYVASQRGHHEAVERLLGYGAAPDATAEGSTPLMIALYMASSVPGASEAHLLCVEALLHAGASLDAIDANGRTALGWAPPGWHAALRRAAGYALSGMDGADIVVGAIQQIEDHQRAEWLRAREEQRAAAADAHARERARAREAEGGSCGDVFDNVFRCFNGEQETAAAGPSVVPPGAGKAAAGLNSWDSMSA